MSKKNDLEHTSTTLGSQNMKSSQRMVSVVEPYELPEGWKWCRLGDVCRTFSDGDWIESKDQSTEGIRLIQTGNIGKGTFRDKDDKCRYISENTFERLNCTEIFAGDILISRLPEPVGRACIIPQLKDRMITAVDCAIVRLFEGAVEKKWFCFYTQSHVYDGFVKTSCTGTTRLRISRKNLGEIPFPLPPTFAEQQRIVKRIESMFAKLDEAKEKAQNVVDGFETRKAAILHKAFTGELTAKWRKENGVCDDSWEEKLFDSCIAKMQNGLSKRSGNEGEETVVLRLANMGEDDFDVSDLRTIKLTSKEKNNYSLAKNDVVMIRVNGSKTNVGRQLLVKNNKGWSFCDHIIRIQFETFCLPNYMVYFSKTKEYIDYVQDNMVSSAGQNTISRKGLSNLSLKVPTLPEQVEIVRILDIIIEKENKAKQAAEAVLEQIDLLKKSILARAFRGEL